MQETAVRLFRMACSWLLVVLSRVWLLLLVQDLPVLAFYLWCALKGFLLFACSFHVFK